MRNITIFLICITFISCSVNKNTSTDLEKFGLLGKVKRHKFERRSYVEQESEETYFLENEYFFNQNGLISEQRQYSSEELVKIYSYKYNDNNILISKICRANSGKFLSKSKYENVFNKKGKLIKQSEFFGLGDPLKDSINLNYNLIPNQITKFYYDSDWNLIKYDIYDRSFSGIKEVMELNGRKIVKTSTVQIKDGEIFSESTYYCVEYDSKDNCIRYKATDGDSKESYLNATIEYYE